MSVKEKFTAAKQGVKKGLSKPFNAAKAADRRFDKALEKHPGVYYAGLCAAWGVVAATTGGLAVPILAGVMSTGFGLVSFDKAMQSNLKKHGTSKKNPPPSGGPA